MTEEIMRSQPVPTPGEYLEQHPITVHLRSLGLQPELLESVRFKRREGEEFSDWAVFSRAWPVNLLHDRHVYCTLRWLILDDPPPSRDRRDAWDAIARYMADSTYKAGAAIRAARAKGLEKSKDTKRKQRETAIKRDRRIHDARTAGKKPKQIAGDKKIRGKKKLSASQVRKILKLPRP